MVGGSTRHCREYSGGHYDYIGEGVQYIPRNLYTVLGEETESFECAGESGYSFQTRSRTCEMMGPTNNSHCLILSRTLYASHPQCANLYI